MNSDQQSLFRGWLLKYFACFPGSLVQGHVPAAHAMSYWEMLGGFDARDVHKAFASCTRQGGDRPMSAGRIAEEALKHQKTRQWDQRFDQAQAAPPSAQLPAYSHSSRGDGLPVDADDIPKDPKYKNDPKIWTKGVRNATNYYLDMIRAYKHKGVSNSEIAEKFIAQLAKRDPAASRAYEPRDPKARIQTQVRADPATQRNASGCEDLPSKPVERVFQGFEEKD